MKENKVLTPEAYLESQVSEFLDNLREHNLDNAVFIWMRHYANYVTCKTLVNNRERGAQKPEVDNTTKPPKDFEEVIDKAFGDNSSPFTKDEQEVMDLITKTHNTMVEKCGQNMSDMQSWAHAIHTLQNIVMYRTFCRKYPNYFIKFKNK